VCGIVGIFEFGRQRAVDASQLERMRDSMVHRGPDGAGLWIAPDASVGLGHRRLSIIDLSAAAAQPMTNEDGTIWVTYNGEIYNHAVLRRELAAAGHVFRTDHSDTEVLVHGYEQWGIDGLARRIEGDYGLGLWDSRQHKLHLLRDRVGVKPVYFSLQRPGRVVFASEIKALIADPHAYAEVDPLAMYHYLSFLTTPAPLTMFAGIYKIPAGYYLTFGDRGLEQARRYWDALPGGEDATAELARMSFDEREHYYVEGIRSRLRSAVAKRMMSDVPFGVLLSGGIDSSTNVALMAELMNRPVRTFTVGFKDHPHLNELEEARLVSRRFNTEHHEVMIDERDMTGYLGQLIHSQDEPIADWVCIPLYFVSKLVRDSGTTVVQVGEGSDEQFSGYASYMEYLKLHDRYWTPFRKLPRIAQGGIAATARFAARCKPSWDIYADVIDRAARDRHHFWSGATVFWNLTKRRLVDPRSIASGEVAPELLASGLLPREYLTPDTFNIVRDFRQRLLATQPNPDPLACMVYNEFKLRLPELLLMRVDKIGMSTSIEARVPFLDHHLVEFTSGIPREHKVRGGVAKHLLKQAVSGWIPDEIIKRRKMGFGAPMSQWLRGPFGEQVERTLMSSRLLDRGWLDRAYIRRLCQSHRAGRSDCALYIWTLFNLTAWYDYWIDRPAELARA
jgi:asparagine synthase (glutamine-hydrolysing)